MARPRKRGESYGVPGAAKNTGDGACPGPRDSGVSWEGPDTDDVACPCADLSPALAWGRRRISDMVLLDDSMKDGLGSWPARQFKRQAALWFAKVRDR